MHKILAKKNQVEYYKRFIFDRKYKLFQNIYKI